MSERPWWISVLWQFGFALVCLLSASVEPSDPASSGRPSESNRDLAFQLGVVVRSLSPAQDEDAQATLRFFREQPASSPGGSRWGNGKQRVYPLEAEMRLDLGDETRIELPEGVYQVVARARGHARLIKRFRLERDSQLAIELEPERTLSVKVVVDQDDSLVPLARATVLVGDVDATPVGGVTGSDGLVQFTEIPRGPARVRIFAPGYASYEAVTEADLVVRLRPSSVLRVRVEREGQLVPGARVYIAGISLWPTRTVETGKKGWVDISGLSPGSYSLYAQHESWVSEVKRSVGVKSESGRSEVVLTLEEASPLRVRVVADKSEAPVAQARVSVRSSGLGQFSHHGISDARGEVSLGPMPEKGGWLTVRAPGYVANSLELGADSEAKQGDTWVVRLVEAGTLSGRVVDERGFPIAGATVEAAGVGPSGEPISVTVQSESVSDAHFDWAREMGQQGVLLPAGELGVLLGPVPPIPLIDAPAPRGAHFTSDEKGRFTIVDVPPGELVVLARHPRFIDGKSSVVKLGSGEQKELEVVLTSGRPLRGRVVDHREFPVKYAGVTVTSRSYSRRVETDNGGFFEVEAAPVHVSLRVADPENPLRVLSAQDVSEKERDQEILIVLPEPRDDTELTVLDPEGEPVELAQVKVTSLERKAPLSLTRFSQADGRALLPRAAGLSVRLRVEAVGFVQIQREMTLAKNIRVTLERSSRAEGRVLGVRGRAPAVGARVTLVSPSATRHALAKDDGSYVLFDVPEGPAQLSAIHDEYGKGSRSVEVRAGVRGRPAELPDLELEPVLQVRGIVQTADGRPISGALVGIERVSAYVPSDGGVGVLGRTDEAGAFAIDVEREATFHVYAALPARAYGWSGAVALTERDEIDDVTVVVDHADEIAPDEIATVLASLEERGTKLLFYAVARPSRAAEDGLKSEDELLAVDGREPHDLRDARNLLSGVAGTEVQLTVRRGGSPRHIVTTREVFVR